MTVHVLPANPANNPGKQPLVPGRWLAAKCSAAILVVLAGFALLLSVAAGVTAVRAAEPEGARHEFYFTRGIYGTTGLGDEDWGPRWAVDFPKADQQLLVALQRLTIVDAFGQEHALRLEDPRLRDFPFVYVLEVGSLNLKDSHAKALREFLLSGGFMVIDDFWGSWEWENFEAQMRIVFPNRAIRPVPLSHPVFNAFYEIPEILQVPNVYQAAGGQTHEGDGKVPHVRGIFDDAGRLMVLINWNTDLGDAWEWADNPHYPLRYSTYAYEMAINFVIYGMTY